MVVFKAVFEREYLVCDCLPVFQPATFQIVLELSLHVIWQRSTLCFQVLSQGRKVLLNDLVEQSLFWLVALVTRPGNAAGGPVRRGFHAGSLQRTQLGCTPAMAPSAIVLPLGQRLASHHVVHRLGDR